jgi:hypothetical protein
MLEVPGRFIVNNCQAERLQRLLGAVNVYREKNTIKRKYGYRAQFYL